MPASFPRIRHALRASLVVSALTTAALGVGCGEDPAPLGAACDAANECGSGLCVDGVCCDAVCDGSCDACTAAVTGLEDGHCGPAPSTTVCRAAAGTCDHAESCDGTNAACPTDDFVVANAPCRAAAGACDVEEVCDGASAACPTDVRLDSTTTCRPAAGECDVDETCDGTNVDCPSDARAPSTQVCHASLGACDPEETCDGGVDCPADVIASSGTVCRASLGPCDPAEVCSGSATACPSEVSQVGVAAAACAPYLCTSDPSCPTSCTGPTQCAAGHACSGGLCLPSKRVFATSTTYTAALGGPSGADGLCQARADAAGLVGTYRAWLSDASSSPSSRFVLHTGPYARTDGIVVADSWADLTDGSIDAIIDRNEFGSQVPLGRVWSQTNATGTYYAYTFTCSGMTNGTSASEGLTGMIGYLDGTWSVAGQDVCNASYRLYCFEQ